MAQKDAMFTIKITGTGVYDSEGDAKETLRKAVKDVFNKVNLKNELKEALNDKTFKVDSSFKVNSIDYLGNDVDAGESGPF